VLLGAIELDFRRPHCEFPTQAAIVKNWYSCEKLVPDGYCSNVTAVPSFGPLPSHAVRKFPRNATNSCGVSPASCREVCINALTSAWMPRMEWPRGRCRRPPRCTSRYRSGDRSPLKRGSTSMSCCCSRRKARSASCTRARRGRLSAARARRERRVAQRALPVAEGEVEPARLSVEPVPLDSEAEPDGLGSLSVDEQVPEDGSDASRRERRRRGIPRVETSLGRPSPAGRCDCDRVGVLGRELRLTRHRTAAANRDRPPPRGPQRPTPVLARGLSPAARPSPG